MFDFQKKLAAVSKECLQKNFDVLPDIHFEFSIGEGRGDLTTSVALQIAKNVKKKPIEIATVLADALSSVEEVETAEAVMPGYVNVTLNTPILFASLDVVIDACEPEKTRTKEKPVIVEYSQPNIAKPLGIHHIIGTVLGQSVSNLYQHQGYNVLRWNYIGDWGTQFGKLAVAKERWSPKKETKNMTVEELLTLYVRFHEEMEKDPTLEEEGRKASKKLEDGDTALRSFWSDVVTITKNSLEDLYTRLHVAFDLDLGESFYEDKMDTVLEEGKKKGVIVEGKEGALIVEFPEEKYPPYLLLRSDGGTLYSTRDLAQMKYRIEEYDPQSILIFTDIAQKLHFEQLVETCTMLGWKLPTFENVLFGRMRFADRSMSTRTGNILRLEEALDEAVTRATKIIEGRGEKIQTDDAEELAEMIGVGALVYGILHQNRKMDLTFDWDKMLSFEGNSAPYLQYTHARAKSVLRKAELKDAPIAGTSTLTKNERTLIKLLLNFSSVLEAARTEHLPHKLTNYLYEVCQAFNSFYSSDEILTAAVDSRSSRLGLTSLTARVLKTGAELLTLRVPERM